MVAVVVVAIAVVDVVIAMTVEVTGELD